MKIDIYLNKKNRKICTCFNTILFTASAILICKFDRFYEPLFLFSALVCTHQDSQVDVYLLVDCESNTRLRNNIWDIPYYLASFFYPNQYKSGVRLWIISTAPSGGQSVPAIALDPTVTDTTKLESILSTINTYRNCDRYQRVPLSQGLNRIRGLVLENGRKYKIAIVTARIETYLNSDQALPMAVKQFSDNNELPIFYYVSQARPATLAFMQSDIIFRVAFPFSMFKEELSKELCNLIPHATTYQRQTSVNDISTSPQGYFIMNIIRLNLNFTNNSFGFGLESFWSGQL